MDLVFGSVVAETDLPVDRVYFPYTGVISLVVEMTVGDMIETAMVGRDGVANGTSALDGKVALHRGIVQVAGDASTVTRTPCEVSPTISNRCAVSSFVTNKCCSRRPSNRLAVTRATPSKHACADGCYAYAI